MATIDELTGVALVMGELKAAAWVTRTRVTAATKELAARGEAAAGRQAEMSLRVVVMLAL